MVRVVTPREFRHLPDRDTVGRFDLTQEAPLPNSFGVSCHRVRHFSVPLPVSMIEGLLFWEPCDLPCHTLPVSWLYRGQRRGGHDESARRCDEDSALVQHERERAKASEPGRIHTGGSGAARAVPILRTRARSTEPHPFERLARGTVPPLSPFRHETAAAPKDSSSVASVSPVPLVASVALVTTGTHHSTGSRSPRHGEVRRADAPSSSSASGGAPRARVRTGYSSFRSAGVVIASGFSLRITKC